MRILISLTIAFLLIPVAFAYDGQTDTYTLYDKDWNRDGYAVEKEDRETIELYNKDWTRRGYVKKEGDRYVIYDREWRREGFIEVDRDTPGAPAGRRR